MRRIGFYSMNGRARFHIFSKQRFWIRQKYNKGKTNQAFFFSNYCTFFMCNRYLAISTTGTIVWAAVHPINQNMIKFVGQQDLRALKRITNVKKDPNSLSFQFDNATHQFYMEQP